MSIPVEHPLAYYGALAAAMSACLYLFVSCGRQLEGLRRRIGGVETEQEAAGTKAEALERRVGEWSGRTTELEERVSGLIAARRAQLSGRGVDANQRVQVLRMAKRGEQVERIAAELRVPQSEVALLLKVHRAVAGAA